MFKVRNGLAPEITNNVFQINPSVYNLRNSEFKTENVKTVHYGTESLSFLGPRIWKLVPLEIKKLTSLQIFKNKIKTWAPENCPCRLCKTYVQGVGFVWIITNLLPIFFYIFNIFNIYLWLLHF